MMLNMDLPVPLVPPSPTAFGFVSWDGAGHPRACPLAAFGCPRGEPTALTARLVCVDPPRADAPEIANARDVAGAIALVVRGGCSFAAKARRVQAAGAVAMVLANNTREESDAAFTMAEDELPPVERPPLPQITIPCVMMCLLDVRELFQKFPPTTQSGVLTLQVLRPDEAAVKAAESLRIRQEMKRKFEEQRSRGNGGGWGVGSALKRKTTALMKLMETQPVLTTNGALPASTQLASQKATTATETRDAPADVPTTFDEQPSTSAASAIYETPSTATLLAEKPAPLVAFVQWATSADTYLLEFAPLADFCRTRDGAVFDAPLVVCDPVLADTDHIANAAALRGSIALVKRGACTFPAKLERAQACSAAAVIVGNNDAENPDAAFVMSVDSISTDHITIPAVMISSTTFHRLTSDKPARIRVLCVAAGPAAADLLARSGSICRISEASYDREEASPVVEDDESARGSGDVQVNPADFNDSVRAFRAACRAGDYETCLRLMDVMCADDAALMQRFVSAHDSNWRRSLHYACAGGDERTVELLLQRGASPFEIDLVAQNPLHVASAHGHTACVKLLLQAASYFSRTEEEDDGSLRLLAADIGGSTPIHLATIAGSTDTLELLLTASAQVAEDGTYRFEGVNERNADGATPLHLACRYERADCAVYLLAASADIDAIDASGSSPLAISCDMLNEYPDDAAPDSLFIVEKLITAGATMDQSSTPGTSGSALGESSAKSRHLLLDRIDSPTVKRDVEVLYLRHQIQSLRSTLHTLKHEKRDLSERVNFLDRSIEQLQRQQKAQQSAAEQQSTRFTCQIDQLQCQMSSLLQLLRANSGANQLIGGNCSALSLVASVSDTFFSSSANGDIVSDKRSKSEGLERAVEDTTISSKMIYKSKASSPTNCSAAAQQELALDAGLARDLGKKLMRHRKFDLAEAYFARSLEILPLPGVAQLRKKARAAQLEGFNSPEAPDTDPRTSVAASKDSVWFGNEAQLKQATIQRLIAAVIASGAPEHVRVSLEREVNKLKTVPGASNEFELACKWLRWLTSLPWGDPTSGLVSMENKSGPWDRAGSTFDTFLELERLERDHDRRNKDRAARCIQQVTRQWLACRSTSASYTKTVAAIRIQRGFRCCRLRRIASTLREQSTDIFASASSTDAPGCEMLDNHQPRRNEEYDDFTVDYNAEVDQVALRKLPRRHYFSVENGVKLCGNDGHQHFRILQVIRAQSKTHRLVNVTATLLDQPEHPTHAEKMQYFVWTRWRRGRGADGRSQGALSGPYEHPEFAQRRYERLLADECASLRCQALPGDAGCTVASLPVFPISAQRVSTTSA